MVNILSTLVGLAYLSLLLYSCVLWVNAFGKLRQGKRLLDFEPRRPVPWGLGDLLVIIIVSIGVLATTQIAIVYTFDIPPNASTHDLPPWQLAITLLASSAAMVVGCLLAMSILFLRAKANWADIGFQMRFFKQDLKIGFGAFAMLAPPMYLLQLALTQLWFTSEHAVQNLMMRNHSLAMLATTILTAMIVAPITEEIFFRVIFQGWLENAAVIIKTYICGSTESPALDRTDTDDDVRSILLGVPEISTAETHLEQAKLANDNTAAEVCSTDGRRLSSPAYHTRMLQGTIIAFIPMAISAEVFACLHVGHGPDPIPLLFLALGLGYVYQRTHRATPCIVVHLLVNSLSVVSLLVYLLTTSGGPES